MPWWLHPRFAVLFLGIPLLAGAFFVTRDTYLTLYGTEKYVDLNYFLIGLVIYAGFLAGTLIPSGRRARSQERDLLLYCRFFVWPLFALTLFGYTVWIAYATLQAGGLASLAGSLLDVLGQQDPGASNYLKKELFQNLPGITTCTQFGILYATVEALLWVRGGSQPKIALIRFGIILLLSLSRALLVSERLALVEIAAPVAVILMSKSGRNHISRMFVRFAPLLLGFGAFLLFALTEYFRSWVFYRQTYSGSYLQFVWERFLGYYATSVNNAAVVYYHEPLHPFRHTLESLFKFPIIGEQVNEIHAALFGSEYAGPKQLLLTYANPEFNNVPLIGLLPNEYSVFLAPGVAFFLGLLSVSVYRSFANGRLIGLILYPSWFVGMLEISRVYYWASQRYFPVLAFLVLSLLLFKLAKVPVPPPLRRRDSVLEAEVVLGRR